MPRARLERLEKAIEAYRAETGSALKSLQNISRRLDGLNLILNQTVAGVNTYETANKAAVQSLRADLDWAIRQVKLLAQVEPERDPEHEAAEPGKPWADAWEAAGPQGPVATGYLANVRLSGTWEPHWTTAAECHGRHRFAIDRVLDGLNSVHRDLKQGKPRAQELARLIESLAGVANQLWAAEYAPGQPNH